MQQITLTMEIQTWMKLLIPAVRIIRHQKRHSLIWISGFFFPFNKANNSKYITQQNNLLYTAYVILERKNSLCTVLLTATAFDANFQTN